MTSRAYRSPQRVEQANATRRRILSCAEGLFAQRGFAAVSMPEIAKDAGVSLATTYLYFAGKAAIVGALADDLVASPDLSVEQVERAGDPLSQLRIGARIIRLLNERAWLLAEILRSARGTDERLAAVWTTWLERHLQAMRRGVVAVASHVGLRAGLGEDEAVDVLYAIAGTDVYRALVSERGWTPERYELWLFETACRELLRDSEQPASTRLDRSDTIDP